MHPLVRHRRTLDACEVRAERERRYLGRLSAPRAAAFVATLKLLAAVE